MNLFRFDPETGKGIDRFDSSGFVISKIVQSFDEATVSCAYLQLNGAIGYHAATIPQLFIVVHGEGWVRGESPERTLIKTGQAAYWEKGEGHETGTETGMVAIVIEGVNFDPAKFMPPV